jgi:8-oxo-dGTP diphosphatase
MTKIFHDSETLKEGQQVFTACAFVHQKFDGVEKVFLPKRAQTKKFLPGVYELPGGHIDFGEDMVTGLKREVHEEFGMRVAVGDPFAVFTYENAIKKSHSIEVVYFARFEDPIDQITLAPEDHSAYVWVAEDELHTIYTANKLEDDEEMRVIKRGFALLRGEALDIAI